MESPGKSGAKLDTFSSPEKEVFDWLKEMNCGQYATKFIEEGFDSMEALLQMSAEDLNELSVKKGHRKLMLVRLQKIGHSPAPGYTKSFAILLCCCSEIFFVVRSLFLFFRPSE